jgi:hypothetical protein
MLKNPYSINIQKYTTIIEIKSTPIDLDYSALPFFDIGIILYLQSVKKIKITTYTKSY